jgi:hypothetical protein
MTVSIEELQRQLETGQLTATDLLSMRQELGAPFRLHPLGFIVCTLLTEGASKFRLHFWPVIGGVQQSPECQIHDHLFEFKSWVLAGAVENIEYVASAQGESFALYRTEYIGDRSQLTKTDNTLRLAEVERRTHFAGSSYVVPAGVLHETTRVGTRPALTVLVTTDVSSAAPLVAGPANGHESYVYERRVVDEAAIQEMLAGV